MDIQTLNVAARVGAIETVELFDGYDKGKAPRKRLFRRWTMDDIRVYGGGTVWFEANDGKARQCRNNGRMKIWKRRPDSFEQSFKYGLYESFRMDTQDMLRRLLVPLGD